MYLDQEYDPAAPGFANNDGTRDAATTVLSTADLTQGYHRIHVVFFEKEGSETMELRWRSPDAGVTSEEKIPTGFLAYETSTLPAAPPTPTDLQAAATAYNRINLNGRYGQACGIGITTFNCNCGTIRTSTISKVRRYIDTTVRLTQYFYKIRASSERKSAYDAG